MVERMIGASRLDVHTYEEVEADRGAFWQALLVVIVVAIASGVGSLTAAQNFIGVLLFGVAGALAQWIVWAFVTLLIGTTIFKTSRTSATWGQMARVTGFAQSPGVLKVFGVIPFFGPIIFFIVTIWQLIAMVIAVRQALDYESTLRSVGVVVVGFIVVLAVYLLLSLAAAALTPL